MIRFEFATAGRILFGRGTLTQVPSIVREFGRSALVVTGSNASRAKTLLESLAVAGIQSKSFACSGEPTLEIVRAGVRAAKDCHLVIGFGGGSAMDCAKAVAALAANSGEPLDYLEVIGKGQMLENAPMPFVAVPTTAGTGAEVTRNAVLESLEHGVKASLRSPLMLAKAAVVDSDLTLNVPPEITASTGIDTLTQLIEPYVSSRANSFTDLLCREGLGHVTASLEQVFFTGSDRAGRESMSYASLLSGLALANAGLGVVHGFAGPLGGLLHAPHGALCAAILPHGMAANVAALRQRGENHPALARYGEIARILSGGKVDQPEDGVRWVAALCQRLGIQPLRHYGLTPGQIPALVGKASQASSMKANPILLTNEELTTVVESACG